jgi:hypothetical protein
MEVDVEHDWLGMVEVKYEDEEAMAGVAETLPFLLRKVFGRARALARSDWAEIFFCVHSQTLLLNSFLRNASFREKSEGLGGGGKRERKIMVSLMATYRLPPPACAKQLLAHALARPIMATYVCHAVRTAHALRSTKMSKA